MSDALLSSEQIRAARALLRWEQKELAKRSKVSLPSVKRIETQPGPLTARAETVANLIQALEAGGVTFDMTAGHGPGVRLKA